MGQRAFASRADSYKLMAFSEAVATPEKCYLELTVLFYDLAQLRLSSHANTAYTSNVQSIYQYPRINYIYEEIFLKIWNY